MQGSCHHQSILAQSAAQEPELSLYFLTQALSSILSFYSLTRPELFLRKVQTAEQIVIMDVRTSAFIFNEFHFIANEL